jgi:imidazolonepropionase-like amidohydrolase
VRAAWRGIAAQGFEPVVNEEGLAHAQANVRILREANVPILAGTDVGNPFLVPGRSLHEELAMLVDAGLSPLEALQAATSKPAVAFGMRDSLGVVQQGMLADLVLLEANPLEDIHNTQSIAGVVLAGRYLDRAALDALLGTGGD